MNIPAGGADYPTVSIGALGHPSTFAWAFIEKSKSVYDFTGFDAYVNDAKTHGLVASNGVVDVVITFGLTPGWAVADQSTCTAKYGTVQCTAPPDNVQDWKDFITTVVAHYNGVTEPHVRYYELWNEVNAPNYWTGTTSQLVNLAAAAYPIVHTDPNSLLLTPSVTASVQDSSPDNAVTWMTQYLQAGGAQYADGGSFHGYIGRSTTPPLSPYPMPEQNLTAGCTTTTCFGSIITKETAMRSTFDQNGLLGKPMLDTEGSWGLTSNVTDSDTQTAWLARWMILQASYYPKIVQASWYTWGYASDPTTIWGSIESALGVASQAGVAYGQVYSWIVGSAFTSQCTGDTSGTWTCGLMLNSGHKALIAWNINGSAAFTPSQSYTQSKNLAGATAPVTLPLTIGPKPLLLED